MGKFFSVCSGFFRMGFLGCVVGMQPMLHGMVCAQGSLVEFEAPSVTFAVPDSFRELIEKATQPIRATAQVNDSGDAWQLFRRLRPAIRDALGTQGYFSPQIETSPIALYAQDQALSLNIQIDPGPQSRIVSVDIQFDGEINHDEFAERRDRLQAQWLLEVNQPFNQEKWRVSKENVLRDLLAKDFAAATLSQSVADVDPENKTVALRVVYDSGPVFTFGELKVKGLSKYPQDLIARYNSIAPGDRYEQERLLELLAQLQGTVYFSSVDVKINPDEQAPRNVPIEVSVLESNSKRLSAAVGYSSNTGFRTEANYQFNHLFGRAYSLLTGARIEQKRQSAFADVFLPPSKAGMRDSVGVALDQQDISNLSLERSSLGVVRELSRETDEYRLGLSFQSEQRRAFGVSFGENQALVASSAWTHYAVDSRLNPRQGYTAFAQLALAVEQLASDQDFIRLYGRIQRFWSFSPNNLFTARFEAGTVVASARRQIPQDYLFRAGGAGSLRGFDFLDLGVLDQGVLVGARRLMMGSLEYTHWFQGGPWGGAVFTDVGGVSDNWSQLPVQKTLGAGVRYQTLAGPLALDLAKATNQNSFRIHLALGVAF